MVSRGIRQGIPSSKVPRPETEAEGGGMTTFDELNTKYENLVEYRRSKEQERMDREVSYDEDEQCDNALDVRHVPK